jgi:hypothetical protein
MLGTKHCPAREERLRMMMLTAPDPAAAARLRDLVQKYRDLADRLRKDPDAVPLKVFDQKLSAE